MPTPPTVTDHDAQVFIIHLLRTVPADRFRGYGYHVYVPAVIRLFAERELGLQGPDIERQLEPMSPQFLAAAWDLCRRGILRPGVFRYGAQATADGSGGNGYSVTPFGRQWLTEAERDDFVPTEPGRFAQMIAQYSDRFGPAFHARAQEAVRCYGAHAYLACTAMCGAAAESIVLALAIANRPVDDVLRTYNAAGGRRRVENLVVGQRPEALRREFEGFTSLLKYWRDAAAHGGSTTITDNEAYTSLAMLLRFAQFATNHWDALTTV